MTQLDLIAVDAADWTRRGRLARRAGEWLDAVGLTTPFRRDCALAVLLAAVSVAMLILPDQAGIEHAVRPPLAETVVVAAQALALCLRRIRPVTCLTAVLVLQIVLAGQVPRGEGWRGLAIAVAVYSCATVFRAQESFLLAGVATFVEVASYFFLSFGRIALVADSSWTAATITAKLAGTAVVALLLYVGAALIGQNVAIRRRYVEVVRLRDLDAAEAQRARVEAAVNAERAAMARDLHDVAAHHITTLVVQALLVEKLVDRDPDEARRNVAGIREEGRNALNNLRLIVTTLRGTHPYLPQEEVQVPGVAMLGDLAGDRLKVTGEPGYLSEAADLAFYRVAQEALSNARDHAPGAEVTVKLTHAERQTVLEVRNGPVTEPVKSSDRTHRGYGLIGMRERAALIGGTLDAGPAWDGGWRVRLTLPRETAPAE